MGGDCKYRNKEFKRGFLGSIVRLELGIAITLFCSTVKQHTETYDSVSKCLNYIYIWCQIFKTQLKTIAAVSPIFFEAMRTLWNVVCCKFITYYANKWRKKYGH